MRTLKVINDGWYFSQEAVQPPVILPQNWTQVNLPYTWNGKDGQDGGNDYYRGTCFFARNIRASDLPAGEEFYLQFDGVNSSAAVFFNGEKICAHDGGYSTFRAKLPGIREDNLLVVSVDNASNDSIYPQLADFTFYGGIYRDVTVIGVPRTHFDLDFYGAPGIKVTPVLTRQNAEAPAEQEADIRLQAFAEGTVRFEILADGNVIASETKTGKNPETSIKLKNPRLWNGVKDPYLYTARACLLVNGETADEITARFGIRSFFIDPQKGFFLNGKEYPLRGVSRHQDRPDIGNALLPAHHREDIALICEMGANTVRLAHYQHAQLFYDLCDEKGLIVWAEIPYISKHMPGGVANTKSQMCELIYQNYNHPSIAVWGLSNEISMSGTADKGLVENHRMLNDLVHSLDPARPTVLAAVSMCPIDETYIHISDLLSYNHYFGWYGGSVAMYGPWFDAFHQKYPDKPIGISEYGCEALNWHTSTPRQGDYTEEYQAFYHEEVIKQIIDRPYLWATHVWNMFDFAADSRNEGGESGMNHKGLVSFDRKYKKDSFYAYKAWLSDEPFVHICSKRYVDRTEPLTRITVYSNQKEVELFANGKSVGKQTREKYPFFYFEVKNEGETQLLAKAGSCCDSAVIKKVQQPNPDYILKEEGDVINWFEIDTPAGYCSINDPIGDIWASFRGKLVLLSLIPSLTKALNGGKPEKSSGKDKKRKAKSGKSKGPSVAGFPVNRTMLQMAMGFSFKRILSMTGIKLSKEELLAVNRKFNKIKKR